MTLARALIAVAEQQPDAPAVIEAHGPTWTWRQLQQLALGAASHLDGIVSQGDRVLLQQEDRAHLLAWMWGTWSIGATAVPMPHTATDHELRFVQNHSGATVTVTQAPAPAHGSLPNHAGDVDALLLYTSGSSGDPKGVRLLHENVLHSTRATSDWYGWNRKTRMLSVLSLCHGHGLIVTALAPLLAGGTVVLGPPFGAFSAGRFWPSCAEHQVTCFSVVPAILRTLLGLTTPADRAEATRLTYGLSASAPLSAELQSQFEETFNLPIANSYGMTETATWVARGAPTGPRRKPGSVGTPADQTIFIYANGDPVGPNEVGEVVIRGAQVSPGYLGNPDANATAFGDQGLHTGDLGKIDSDGFLHLVGRRSNLIFVGAEKVAPEEIEEVLCAHPAIHEAAVWPEEHPTYGQIPIATVVCHEPVSTATLHQWCRNHLSAHKTPRRFRFIDALPRNSRGKLDRKNPLLRGGP